MTDFIEQELELGCVVAFPKYRGNGSLYAGVITGVTDKRVKIHIISAYSFSRMRYVTDYGGPIAELVRIRRLPKGDFTIAMTIAGANGMELKL